MITINYNDNSTTLEALDVHIAANQGPGRGWLGLSEIGHKCERYLWYMSHGYGEFGVPDEARYVDIYAMGDYIEARLRKQFCDAGFDITDDQKEIEFTQGDLKLIGHIDGIIHNLFEAPKTPHLWECKSARNTVFSAICKLGYEEYSEKRGLGGPQYKTQIHVYMLGLGLKRAYVVVQCKNDCKKYAERVRLDKAYAIDKLQRTFEIMSLNSAPIGTCPHENHFEAKLCSMRGFCFGGCGSPRVVGKIAPLETRKRFAKAVAENDEYTKMEMFGMFLGNALSDENIYVAGLDIPKEC